MKLEEKVGELLKAKKIVPFHRRKLYGWRNCRSDNFRSWQFEYFNGSIVAYSNEIKMSLLHVSAETLEKIWSSNRETVTEW